MRFFSLFFLLTCALFSVTAEEELSDILSGIHGDRNSICPVDLEILTAMLEYADTQEKTIFELLNDSALYLKDRGIRIHLNGDDLRLLNRRFELGGTRVNTLLPVEKISHIEIGAVLRKDEPAMEVILFEEHSDFLELGDFFLSKRFGFQDLDAAWYRGGFGITVKSLFMSLELEQLNLYDERKIAIWVHGIPRPKRWRIDPIKERRDYSEQL